MINITAQDCHRFYDCNNKGKKTDKFADGNIIQSFLNTIDPNIITLTNKERQDKSRLAEYQKWGNDAWGWYAGRYIGEAVFKHDNKDYKITITPRFGNDVLHYMLCEIAHIKITPSQVKIQDNDSMLIKKIMAILWLKKLHDAHRFGLPRIKSQQRHQGSMIRGRIHIRESILPLYTQKQIVSYSREKTINPIIASTLYHAYQYLKPYINQNNITDNAQQAIDTILKNAPYKPLRDGDIKNIKYNAIDYIWKDIINFSQQIIKNKGFALEHHRDHKNGYSFFLDMAEIWEEYIKAVLNKNLAEWRLWSTDECEVKTYKGLFFARKMIPDIILQRGDDIMVFDAKYKRMQNDKLDVDRGDFYQIHSYMQYFQNKHKLLAGGLLYPLVDKLSKNTSPTLFGLDSDKKCKFIIDGIEIDHDEFENNNNKLELLKNFEQKFIKNITNLFNTENNKNIKNVGY